MRGAEIRTARIRRVRKEVGSETAMYVEKKDSKGETGAMRKSERTRKGS